VAKLDLQRGGWPGARSKEKGARGRLLESELQEGKKSLLQTLVFKKKKRKFPPILPRGKGGLRQLSRDAGAPEKIRRWDVTGPHV